MGKSALGVLQKFYPSNTMVPNVSRQTLVEHSPKSLELLRLIFTPIMGHFGGACSRKHTL